MIKSWIEMGHAPDLDAATDMTPVGYVSSAIVHLSRLKQSLGKVFHLVNPRPVFVRELVSWIRLFGYSLEPMPYDQWRAKLIDLAGSSRDSALYSLLPLFSGRVSEKVPRSVGRMPEFDGPNTLDGLGSAIAAQYAKRSVRFDYQNTLDGLTGTSVVCPIVGAKLFNTYLSYFVRSGFLDTPHSLDPTGDLSNNQGTAHDSS